MREEGLQARGAYKEVPRASRRLALATPKSVHPCKGQNNPYIIPLVDNLEILKIFRDKDKEE